MLPVDEWGPIRLPKNNFPRFLALSYEILALTSCSFFFFPQNELFLQLSSLLSLLPVHKSFRVQKSFYILYSLVCVLCVLCVVYVCVQADIIIIKSLWGFLLSILVNSIR